MATMIVKIASTELLPFLTPLMIIMWGILFTPSLQESVFPATTKTVIAWCSILNRLPKAKLKQWWKKLESVIVKFPVDRKNIKSMLT